VIRKQSDAFASSVLICRSDFADAPDTVMTTPTMLRGVSSSPKNQDDMVIVVTSFAIPAIDVGTIPARLMMLCDAK
jgi:hypothetical protein